MAGHPVSSPPHHLCHISLGDLVPYAQRVMGMAALVVVYSMCISKNTYPESPVSPTLSGPICQLRRNDADPFPLRRKTRENIDRVAKPPALVPLKKWKVNK
ncbi:hypothetical protein EYF80_036002 [Liparis tanakae]|uniref:Uncharacterized protein n=1 Tax=Liparis tanakae TaxID=230148 RepID=A0A4Z2GJR0_9TELE|nr:hypothetical protein EYF80_036002 [Liparis tanakae]